MHYKSAIFIIRLGFSSSKRSFVCISCCSIGFKLVRPSARILVNTFLVGGVVTNSISKRLWTSLIFSVLQNPFTLVKRQFIFSHVYYWIHNRYQCKTDVFNYQPILFYYFYLCSLPSNKHSTRQTNWVTLELNISQLFSFIFVLKFNSEKLLTLPRSEFINYFFNANIFKTNWWIKKYFSKHFWRFLVTAIGLLKDYITLSKSE